MQFEFWQRSGLSGMVLKGLKTRLLVWFVCLCVCACVWYVCVCKAFHGAVTYLVDAPSRTSSPHMYWKMIWQLAFWSAHECWLVHSTGTKDPA